MFSKATIVSAIFGLAAAQLHPAVGEPKGNPITRPLNEVVPTCEKFTITWEPTTPNTVSVLLLKGPASNVVKFGPALAQGIANSGSLAWTPASDLPLTDSPNGYGIQIIDDVTGQYQYSTQFGLKAGKCEDASKPSPAASSSPVATPEPAKSTPAGYATNTPVPQSSAAGYPTLAPYPTTVATQSSPAPAAGTGMPYPNGTVPAGAATPTAGRPMNTTTGRLPEVTANAASSIQAGLGLAGAAAAAMAFML